MFTNFCHVLSSGLIGAIVLNIIDKCIAKKQKNIKTGEIIHQKNKVLDIQTKVIKVSEVQLEKTKITTAEGIVSRHQEASAITKRKIGEIESDLDEIYDKSYLNDITPSSNSAKIKDLIDDIESV